MPNTSGFIKEGNTEPLKLKDMYITGFGLKPVSYTNKGMPQTDQDVIKALSGEDPKNGKYGLAYEELSHSENLYADDCHLSKLSV